MSLAFCRGCRDCEKEQKRIRLIGSVDICHNFTFNETTRTDELEMDGIARGSINSFLETWHFSSPK